MAFRLSQSWRSVLAVTAGFALTTAMTSPAAALSIELKDVAADRVERQRDFAAGALPLPGTPNVAILDERLKEKGVTLTSPILIRVFKAESELEIWKEKSGVFELFAVYPICHWSGTIGPKLRTGDKQAPEGFYTVSRGQIRPTQRHPKAINIGFPNVLDQSQARTGSDILLHGGCSSIGCFAMTNPVIDEIHQIMISAVESGQHDVPVHVFPFRMTDVNMEAHTGSPWANFWANLKEGYDAFEAWKRPPTISICDARYSFRQTGRGTESGPLEPCETTLSVIREQDQWLRSVPAPGGRIPFTPRYNGVAPPDEQQTKLGSDKQTAVMPRRRALQCDLARASCRRFASLQVKAAKKRAVIAAREPGHRNAVIRPQG